MRVISRSPTVDCCSVLGIGVADRVITSRWALRPRIFSLCRTPNRCSSSTISKPREGTITSGDKSRCVPIKRSTLPADAFSKIAQLFFSCFESGQQGDIDTEGFKTFFAGDIMLVGQDGGGAEKHARLF